MSAGIVGESIGFLGLGRLGAPIASNLLDAGARLSVWNRTAAKASSLVERGARLASTPADAIPRGGVVFSILWDDASLEDIVNGQGFFDALAGGTHVSMTTVTPATSARVAELHRRHGSAFVEAPIFGIPAQAVARTMLVCIAGAASAKARVLPLLEAMGAQRTVDFGETIGAATATKLVGNFLIVSGFVALAEAFSVLEKNGLDPKPTLELLTTTIAATPGNQRYAGYLLSGSPPPISGIPEKDVGLFAQLASAGGAKAPLAERMHDILRSNRGA